MTWTNNYKTYNPEKEGYGNASQWRSNFRARMNPDECKRILEEDEPYTILGFSHHKITFPEIKKAYRKMAIKWHPDKNPHQIDIATKMMGKINAAYDLLCSIFNK